MGMLKQLVGMYKSGDKVAIMYSTTSGRTYMIHEDGYEVEEYHNIIEEKGSIKGEKEIIVDSAEHLTYSQARELAHSDAKVILLFDQVGGLNGLTVDQLRTLGFVMLVPPENRLHAAGGDIQAVTEQLIDNVLTRRTGHILFNKSSKAKVVPKSKLKNPVVIQNDYDKIIYDAIGKDMDSISKLSAKLNGIGSKTSDEILKLSYDQLAKYSDSLKESSAKQLKHLLNAIDAKDPYMIAKAANMPIKLEDALSKKAIGLPGANARRQADSAFFHTFDEVLVDLERYGMEPDMELNESYAIRLYYAITRATGKVAFGEHVDKSILSMAKKVMKVN